MLCGKPVISLVNCFSEATHALKHSEILHAYKLWHIFWFCWHLGEKHCNMVFFCFSRLDRSINKSSPPCCLLLLCKMPTTSLTALLLPFKFLLLLGLDFRVFFVCLFFSSFQRVMGKEGNRISYQHSMLSVPWNRFALKCYSIIQTVIWCQKLFSIPRLPNRRKKGKKRKRKNKKCYPIPTERSNKKLLTF